MKKINCFIIAFLWICSAAIAENKDSLQHIQDSITIENLKKQIHNPAQQAAADSIIVKDSAHIFEYQFKHPAVLYENINKTKGFTSPFILTLIILLIIGIWLFSKTGLCKTLSYMPNTNTLRAVKERPFSYARVQLFWWTMIILICFTSFFFFTGFLVAFNSTIVLLLGGGIAVSIFGNAIDKNQLKKNDDGVPVRYQDIQPTEGLLTDILSDEGGISIHRFQAVIFNIVFGLGFLYAFYHNVVARNFPFIDFEQWQLTLLGISAAGYLGFKANENSKETEESRKKDAVLTTESAAAANKSAEPAAGTVRIAADTVAPVPVNTPEYTILKNKTLTDQSIAAETTNCAETETPVERNIDNF